MYRYSLQYIAKRTFTEKYIKKKKKRKKLNASGKDVTIIICDYVYSALIIKYSILNSYMISRKLPDFFFLIDV